ncbi:helix-turn-helix transcriptional regulator [Nocardiopsis sp. FR26]|uniref:helix-turn-helix domain-containing protein n=1 Tax=Nocardiopsis sp. FR26 TaxID=2605987 RepID=UPI0013583E56|nr:helix-turn-helix transcriptional regulator [Nocardiopsis sp. FR26]
MSHSSRTARRRRFDADAFRTAREDAGVSIRDLSELTEIPEPTLYKLQQGHRRMPRPRTYRKIILALHLKKGALLVDDVPEEAKAGEE